MTEDLKPQEPGAATAPHDALEAIAESNVGDLVEALDTLTNEQLEQLSKLEAGNKNRTTALGAIQRELDSRETGADNEPKREDGPAPVGDPETYKNMLSKEIDAAKLSAPVLCKDGWLLPLANASAEG